MKQTGSINKFAVAAALKEMGHLLELKGAERFRVQAYMRAARAVADLTDDLGTIVSQNRLTEIKGVGRALAAQISELYTTGRSTFLEELRAELPPGVIELSRVLSVKKIGALHQALGITSIAELRTAAETGLIRKVSGFGAAAEQKILEAISAAEKRDERILLLHALRTGEPLLNYLKECPDVVTVELAGSIRRWKETVSAIRIVAAAVQPERVLEYFLNLPAITKTEDQSDSSCVVRLLDNAKVILTVVAPDEYPTALLHLTGARAHVAQLRAWAASKRLLLTERALSRTGRSQKQLAVKSEDDIYHHLDLRFIAPELREGEGEIEQAREGRLAKDLLTITDIQGMTHCHTTYSDGRNSVEEMARAAQQMGMKYMTITDHSPSAFYANGVKVDRLKRQWDEIDRVQELVDIKLLRGTESDILRDGGLDYPDAILDRFDIVIASIHNRYKMDETQMT